MDKTFDDLKRYAIKLDINKYEIGATILNLIAAHEQLQSKVSELSDKLYHESRRADEVVYLKDGEIKKLQNQLYKTEESSANEYQKVQKLQSKLDKACEALERVKHNGCCTVCSSVCPACNAHKALAEIRKKDE